MIGMVLLWIVFILSFVIVWPWIHAAFIWQGSTIKSLDNLLNNQQIEYIPKILHQTYRNQSSIPFQWQRASNSCRALHSNYEYKFWSDSDARRLIEREFPSLLPTFDSYPYDIQRSDVIRFICLWRYLFRSRYFLFEIISYFIKISNHSTKNRACWSIE